MNGALIDGGTELHCRFNLLQVINKKSYLISISFNLRFRFSTLTKIIVYYSVVLHNEDYMLHLFHVSTIRCVLFCRSKGKKVTDLNEVDRFKMDAKLTSKNAKYEGG